MGENPPPDTANRGDVMKRPDDWGTTAPPRPAALEPLIPAARARELGYSRDEIERLRVARQWATLRRGIYQRGGPEPDPRDQHLACAGAALLAVSSPDAVVAHRSAGVLWGLDFLTPPDLDTVWLAVPELGKVRTYPGLRLWPAQLPASHVTTGPGDLPVTTVARTVVDLARHHHFRAGVAMAESALRRKLTTKPQIDQVLTDCRGWPYTRRAARALEIADGDTESVGESLTRAILAEAGLHPQAQVTICRGDGTTIGRVDFLFADERVIVEFDGRLKYDDPDALWKEKLREDELRAAGYQVIRVTWGQLMNAADDVLRRVRAALRRARAGA
ncbi:type IV toxin-antitoxin system AbiEi family antitoxin domain-containing protein [Sporichthya brevicatena]|uniref:Type IV toxin-antitoxin system AbiEi family antitoxin domain-containing protein n=2 Tax=Sporichthya brevicatena TaxID=171442 RepID=A0ABN1GS98_9ACTN